MGDARVFLVVVEVYHGAIDNRVLQPVARYEDEATARYAARSVADGDRVRAFVIEATQFKPEDTDGRWRR